MAAPLFIFALVALPILFFMLVWVVATVYRICFPEEPIPFEQDPTALREMATAAGQSIPVGVREIREDRRRYVRLHADDMLYCYGATTVPTLPADWVADLELRRN